MDAKVAFTLVKDPRHRVAYIEVNPNASSMRARQCVMVHMRDDTPIYQWGDFNPKDAKAMRTYANTRLAVRDGISPPIWGKKNILCEVVSFPSWTWKTGKILIANYLKTGIIPNSEES